MNRFQAAYQLSIIAMIFFLLSVGSIFAPVWCRKTTLGMFESIQEIVNEINLSETKESKPKPCGCIQAYYPGGPILYVPGCRCERRQAALEWCETYNAERKLK